MGGAGFAGCSRGVKAAGEHTWMNCSEIDECLSFYGSMDFH
jgi:hypothetical protein